jgi:hypothetical protein
MVGRYLPGLMKSPTAMYNINGNYVKEYWGEVQTGQKLAAL